MRALSANADEVVRVYERLDNSAAIIIPEKITT